MDIYDWLIVILFGAIVILGLLGMLRAIFTPLPPWNGLTGEAYKKWKNGEKAEPENDGG